MFGGLYDYFAGNPVFAQLIGLVVFILIIVGTSTAISCHNCSVEQKSKCADGAELGHTVNVTVLVYSYFNGSIPFIFFICFIRWSLNGYKSSWHGNGSN